MLHVVVFEVKDRYNDAACTSQLFGGRLKARITVSMCIAATQEALISG